MTQDEAAYLESINAEIETINDEGNTGTVRLDSADWLRIDNAIIPYGYIIRRVGMLNKLWQWTKRKIIVPIQGKRLDQKIKKGTAPRGRTSPGGEGDVVPGGKLYARHIKGNGEVTELGLIAEKVVTDAGVQYIVDAFQNLVELENMKYHGSGTGTTAEAASQTALVTEIESRATGTTIEGASANIYRTVGTVSYTGTAAVTEHGIFSAASAGVMLDRSVFSAINVVSGDSIEFTYDFTVTSGS